MIAYIENKKIKLAIKAIAIAIIISFLAYDIAWANPDAFSARTLFTQPDQDEEGARDQSHFQGDDLKHLFKVGVPGQ